MIVFYDFETTGFVDKRAPLNAEHQPHIVQAAAIATDDNGRKVASFDVIVRPDGWSIPGQSTAVHGITDAMAHEFGVSEQAALRLLARFIGKAKLRVAHNEEFDCAIMKVAASRYYFDPGLDAELKSLPAFCTMQATRDLCRIPPTERMVAAGITEFKSPRLEEAYRHLFGEEIDGAHDAMVDVTACKRIYEHLKNEGVAA